MFLAPTGNPSSLRFGHPDVATEHTSLSPIPSPLREGGIVGAGCVGSEPRVARLGKSVRGSGEGNAGVRHRRQLAKNEYWGSGHCGDSIWVVRAPSRGLIETGLVVAPCERAAQLYLPEATSGCPSSARAGAPAGAKEVYSVPSAHTSKHLKDVQLTTQLC